MVDFISLWLALFSDFCTRRWWRHLPRVLSCFSLTFPRLVPPSPLICHSSSTFYLHSCATEWQNSRWRMDLKICHKKLLGWGENVRQLSRQDEGDEGVATIVSNTVFHDCKNTFLETSTLMPTLLPLCTFLFTVDRSTCVTCARWDGFHPALSRLWHHQHEHARS